MEPSPKIRASKAVLLLLAFAITFVVVAQAASADPTIIPLSSNPIDGANVSGSHIILGYDVIYAVKAHKGKRLWDNARS